MEVNVLVSLYQGNVVATWLSIYLRHLIPKNALQLFLLRYYVDHFCTFKYNQFHKNLLNSYNLLISLLQ